MPLRCCSNHDILATFVAFRCCSNHNILATFVALRCGSNNKIKSHIRRKPAQSPAPPKTYSGGKGGGRCATRLPLRLLHHGTEESLTSLSCAGSLHVATRKGSCRPPCQRATEGAKCRPSSPLASKRYVRRRSAHGASAIQVPYRARHGACAVQARGIVLDACLRKTARRLAASQEMAFLVRHLSKRWALAW